MSNQHIVPHSEGWAVKGEGNQKATSVHENQQDAFKAARDIAINQGGDTITHGRDGRIRERNTYGKNDNFPPRG